MELMLQLRVFCHRSNCRERSYGGVLNNPVAGAASHQPPRHDERAEPTYRCASGPSYSKTFLYWPLPLPLSVPFSWLRRLRACYKTSP
jgi:hypothetical protein